MFEDTAEKQYFYTEQSSLQKRKWVISRLGQASNLDPVYQTIWQIYNLTPIFVL